MISKEAADYGDGMPKSHCSICAHFVKPDSCRLVDGTISPDGWCKLFEREARKDSDQLDELGIARAIAAGEMTSPQHYQNVWLFAIRITGTGAAYRAGLQEFCWRDPALYLNDEFLARCQGLPVVFEHPDGAMLNTKEFADRTVGTVVVPFIKGDEVWGIAKIYDEPTASLMVQEKLSTSPAVVFHDASDNQKLQLKDGTTLLIEGKPALLDHIAICERGVWDKGGDPSGVDISGGLMTEEEKAAEDKARADANAKLDKIADALTGLSSRMDAYDAARKDAESKAEDEKREREGEERRLEKERADKARRDAARKDRFGARKDGESDEDFSARMDADEVAEREELEKGGDDKEAAADAARKDRRDADEEDKKVREDKARRDAADKEAKEREDKARADAAMTHDTQNLKAQIEALTAELREMKRETPADERDALAAAQARADSVAAMYGDRVPAPLPGETSLAYRRKIAQRFQKHSARFKDENLSGLGHASLQAAEDIIYADAVNMARNTASATPGTLVPIVERDPAGRQITRFHGDPMAWMQHFMTGAQIGHINRNPNA